MTSEQDKIDEEHRQAWAAGQGDDRERAERWRSIAERWRTTALSNYKGVLKLTDIANELRVRGEELCEALATTEAERDAARAEGLEQGRREGRAAAVRAVADAWRDACDSKPEEGIAGTTEAIFGVLRTWRRAVNVAAGRAPDEDYPPAPASPKAAPEPAYKGRYCVVCEAPSLGDRVCSRECDDLDRLAGRPQAEPPAAPPQVIEATMGGETVRLRRYAAPPQPSPLVVGAVARTATRWLRSYLEGLRAADTWATVALGHLAALEEAVHDIGTAAAPPKGAGPGLRKVSDEEVAAAVERLKAARVIALPDWVRTCMERGWWVDLYPELLPPAAPSAPQSETLAENEAQNMKPSPKYEAAERAPQGEPDAHPRTPAEVVEDEHGEEDDLTQWRAWAFIHVGPHRRCSDLREALDKRLAFAAPKGPEAALVHCRTCGRDVPPSEWRDGWRCCARCIEAGDAPETDIDPVAVIDTPAGKVCRACCSPLYGPDDMPRDIAVQRRWAIALSGTDEGVLPSLRRLEQDTQALREAAAPHGGDAGPLTASIARVHVGLEPCTECPTILTSNHCPKCDASVCIMCQARKHPCTKPRRPTVAAIRGGETGEDELQPAHALGTRRSAAEAIVQYDELRGELWCTAPTPEAP